MFQDSLEAFAGNYVFQNACGMCIIQIGELAGRLSTSAQAAIPEIPWPLIKGMRNVFAHDYGHIMIQRTWETLHSDIPLLEQACEKALKAP